MRRYLAVPTTVVAAGLVAATLVEVVPTSSSVAPVDPIAVPEAAPRAAASDIASDPAPAIGRAAGVVPARSPGQRRDRASVDPSGLPAVPLLTVVPDGGANRERVDEAARRFAVAGLRLPDLRIDFSEDGCLGNLGLFDRRTEPWQIHICSDLEFVITHEMAHAWIAAHLDDADREAYVELRGLPAWQDPDLYWRQRGTEDAAFVMQRVLMTEHVRPDWPVWQERSAAYQQLTGRRPPQLAALDADREPSERSGSRGRI